MNSLEEPNEREMRKYFEPGEWDTFSEFEKKRYISMLHNYLIMIELDLNPQEPDFIRKWKIKYLKQSSDLNSQNQDEKKLYSEGLMAPTSEFDCKYKEQGFQPSGRNVHPSGSSIIAAQIKHNNQEESNEKAVQSASLFAKPKQFLIPKKSVKSKTKIPAFVSPKITIKDPQSQFSVTKCVEVENKSVEFSTMTNLIEANDQEPHPSSFIYEKEANFHTEVKSLSGEFKTSINLAPTDQQNCSLSVHTDEEDVQSKSRLSSEYLDIHDCANKFSAIESVYESLFSDKELSQSALMWNFFQSMFEAYVHELMKSSDSREIVLSTLSTATKERLGLNNDFIAGRKGLLPTFFEEPNGTGFSFQDTNCNSENVDLLNDVMFVAQDLIWEDSDNPIKVKDSKTKTFFYCDTCRQQWGDICPLGHQIFSPDQIPPFAFNNDTFYSLPFGLRISKSTLPLCNLGIFSVNVIEVGVVWGPMKGFNSLDTNFSQETLLCRHDYPRNTKYPGYWMKLVNCAYSEKEANTISFVHNGQLYIKSSKRIQPNEEVLLGCWVENSLPSGSSVPTTSTTGITLSHR